MYKPQKLNDDAQREIDKLCENQKQKAGYPLDNNNNSMAHDAVLGDVPITWKEYLDTAPSFKQRQDSTKDQLRDLYNAAIRLGFYDAADWMRHFI